MKNVFLIKYGELAIKGKNRYVFENRLLETVRKNLKSLGEFKVQKEQGRLVAIPSDDNEIDVETVAEKLQRTFGIIGVSYGIRKEEISLESIKELALYHMKELCDERGSFTFKVETKRADKRFPMKSMEVSAAIGEFLLEELGENLTVNVRKPEVLLMVEIRNGVYVYSKTLPGAGGMPYGTNGKATLLLSGGIDSPVAGWMIAKRGVEIDAVYFHSPPYTSERAKDKVVELARKLAIYTGGIKVHVVNFTEIQTTIQKQCPINQLTIIMRRIMMEIAQRIADKNGSQALITGESIGQVASQTMHSLVVTDAAANRPVFRPLIGFDKYEIIKIAEKIDTFETSILPYEDCCTIFVPDHPETKPKLEYIEKSESKLTNLEEMILSSLESVEIINV
ncbi:MAG: tRNA 4-thiouridine(8) synthase ThiI [Candidatus Epulonipiscioides saccharophilum]|nr:MAG: tRNA 4-thiouridine(8) synthase ThiI [Epulopiscium sp. AS2M-Bin001]